MLERGARLVEILKQGQYVPLPVEKQIVIIYAGTKGYLDGLPTSKLGLYEKELYAFLEGKHQDILATIRDKKVIDKDTEASLKKALEAFGKAFGKGDSADKKSEAKGGGGENKKPAAKPAKPTKKPARNEEDAEVEAEEEE
jgi:F-type H+-transporting ATPase subunit alpha